MISILLSKPKKKNYSKISDVVALKIAKIWSEREREKKENTHFRWSQRKKKLIFCDQSKMIDRMIVFHIPYRIQSNQNQLTLQYFPCYSCPLTICLHKHYGWMNNQMVVDYGHVLLYRIEYTYIHRSYANDSRCLFFRSLMESRTHNSNASSHWWYMKYTYMCCFISHRALALIAK